VYSRIFLSFRHLPAWAIVCIAGAAGECGGQIVLYPIETIKVLCQQTGTSAVATLSSMFQGHAPLAVARRLFHGVGSTIPVSILLGAAYLSMFRSSTSFFTRILSPNKPSSPQPNRSILSQTLSKDCNDPKPAQQTQSEYVQTSGNCGHRDEAQRCGGHSHHVRTGGHVSNGNGGAEQAALETVMLSAITTSVSVALVTGPIEMARNRLQAGIVQGSLLVYTFSPRGIRATLPMMGPYCLTAVPHDFAELLTIFFGQAALERYGGRLPIQRGVLDAIVGGAAGALGVFLSAPADCLKTKVITMSLMSDFVRAHKHPAALMAAGAGTKWHMAALHTIRRQGVAGFFVGVVPRLIDEVPGSMLHWSLVEACTRLLDPDRVGNP
jgi:hypothetical protein